LLPAYNILRSLLPYGTEVPGYLRCPFHSLAAILYGFMAFQCEHSEAHEREKLERNPCCEPTMFYASDNTPLRSSRRSRDAGFTIIYPNLRVRLKKVHGFYKGFLRFSSISPLNQQYFQGLFPFPETAESTSFDNVRACSSGIFWEIPR
jgi:hypothetical protein